MDRQTDRQTDSHMITAYTALAQLCAVKTNQRSFLLDPKTTDSREESESVGCNIAANVAGGFLVKHIALQQCDCKMPPYETYADLCRGRPASETTAPGYTTNVFLNYKRMTRHVIIKTYRGPSFSILRLLVGRHTACQ